MFHQILCSFLERTLKAGQSKISNQPHPPTPPPPPKKKKQQQTNKKLHFQQQIHHQQPPETKSFIPQQLQNQK